MTTANNEFAKALSRGSKKNLFDPPSMKGSNRRGGVILADGSFVPIGAFNGGGFDGASHNSQMRGFIVFPDLETRNEINHSNRTEILRKSRWLYNNHGTARRIVRGLARQIGSMMPKPITPDRDWNTLAKKYFKAKTGTPAAFDVARKYSFSAYQTNLSRLWLKDGDSLTVFTEGNDGDPRIKCFEGHQIGDLLKDRFNRFRRQKSREMARQWLDGALIGKDNEHLAYRVLVPGDPSRSSVIPANKSHLFTLWERPGQVRGIGALHHAVNHLHDTTEITADLKLAIKNSAMLGFYLKGREGASRPGKSGIARNARHQAIPRRDDEGTEEDESTGNDELVTVEDMFSAGVIPSWADWEPGVLNDPRPHPNNIELLRWLIREICLGLDFPPELIWELGSLNGNVVRVLNEDVQESLDNHRMELTIPFCQRVWFHVIGHGIATGELPEPEIPEKFEGLVGWWSVEWSPPPRKTIDRGREGNLAMQERSRMMRTLDRHFTDLYSSDWTDEGSQFLDEIDWILNQAEERQWPERRIRALEAMLLASPPGTSSPADLDQADEALRKEEEADPEPGKSKNP